MAPEKINKLLEYIQTDNLAEILQIKGYEKLLNISYGRFPLLTLCYMYNSKKIISKFGKQMSTISDFAVVDEPFSVYCDFKNIAGKSIRIYATNTHIVMPIEMLAIMHKDRVVKKYYSIYAKSDNTQANLEKIYHLSEQNISYKKNKIHITLRKLSKQGQRILIITSSIVLSFIILISFTLSTVSRVYGFGTDASPRLINSLKQLISLDGKELVAKLNTNLIITDETIENFKSTLYGNNKTIELQKGYNGNFISTLTGTIQDINLTYENEQFEITEDFSLLVKTNNGILKNITIDSNILATVNSSENVYISTLAIENNGTITNCTITLNASIQSNTNNDTYLSIISGINNGIISNCKTSETNISTRNIDISGIATFNTSSITNCINNTILNQTSDLEAWSPNVAGIVLNNSGTIMDCINLADIQVVSTSTNAETSVFAGGICSVNTNTITHCKSNCNIITNSDSAITYAGGIVAYMSSNSFADTIVSHCGFNGNIESSKTNTDTFVLSGGIAGFMIGTLTDSYSVGTFTNGYDKENSYMSALLIGGSYYTQSFFSTNIYLNINNVHTLSTINVEKPLAIISGNSGTQYIENLNADIYIHSELSDIESSNVYW